MKELKNRPATRAAVRDAIVARAPDECVPGGRAALADAGRRTAGCLDRDCGRAGGRRQRVRICQNQKSPHRLLHMPLAPEIANLSAAARALRRRPLDARRRAERRPEAARSARRANRQRGRSRMTKNAQRLSQVVSTFGPGAMVDLPTRSVVVGGLELWDMKGDAFTTIPEPRLTMRLEQLLKEQGRLDQRRALSLRTPPVDGRQAGTACRAASRRRCFPTWFVCEQVEIVTVGRQARAPPAAGALAGPRPARRPPQVRLRRRQEIRRDADPLRLRLREGPPAGHRLEMGRARRRAVPGADVDRGEGHQRRSRRHDASSAAAESSCRCRTLFQPGRLGKLPR